MIISHNDIPQADIRSAMAAEGLDTADAIQTVGEGDSKVTLYHVGTVRVLGTNGASVWEEADLAVFAAALEEHGIVDVV